MDVPIYGIPRSQNRVRTVHGHNSQSQVDVLSFQMCALPEIKYTKREIMTSLDVPVEHMNSGQGMATVIIMRKGEHSLSVVNKWNELGETETSSSLSDSDDDDSDYVESKVKSLGIKNVNKYIESKVSEIVSKIIAEKDKKSLKKLKIDSTDDDLTDNTVVKKTSSFKEKKHR